MYLSPGGDPYQEELTPSIPWLLHRVGTPGLMRAELHSQSYKLLFKNKNNWSLEYSESFLDRNLLQVLLY